MYNRYIPQPDGTYQKRRMNGPVQARSPRPKPQPACPPPEMPVPPCDPPQDAPQACPPPEHKPPCHPPAQNSGNLLNFFKNLLPGDLDTADLLIVLLLLLMAGDQSEDKNTALLTLALYFLL